MLLITHGNKLWNKAKKCFVIGPKFEAVASCTLFHGFTTSYNRRVATSASSFTLASISPAL